MRQSREFTADPGLRAAEPSLRRRRGPRSGDRRADQSAGAVGPRRSILRPGLIVGLVLTLWILFPNLIIRNKLLLGLEVICSLLLLAAIGSGRPSARWTIGATLLAGYLVCLVLSVGNYGSLSDLVNSILYLVLTLGTLLASSGFSSRDRDDFIAVVIAAATVEFLIGLAELFAGLSAPWGNLKAKGSVFGDNHVLPALSGRITGTMAQPIPFGSLMATAAMLTLFACPRWPRSWRLGMTAAFVFATMMSGTRSAIIALVIAVLLASVLWNNSPYSGLLRIVVLAAAAATLAFGNLQNNHIFTSLNGTGSFTHRLGALQAVPKLLGRPFWQTIAGSGFNSAEMLFQHRQLQLDNFTAIDNQFVTCLALGGILGVLAIMGLGIWGLARGDRTTRPAAFVCLAMFFGFDVLEWYSVMTLFLALIAVARSTTVRPTESG